MNVHPALLSAFPGAHAISDTLAYGVKVTGVTVMYVWPGGLTNYDNGPIILQAAVPVEEGDGEEALGARIHAVEHRLLPEAVRLHLTGRLRIEGRRVAIAWISSVTAEQRTHSRDAPSLDSLWPACRLYRSLSLFLGAQPK